MFKPRSSKDGTFNLSTPLKTKELTPKAIFKFSTNVQEYNGTYSSQHRCGCYESLFAGESSRKFYASC